MAKTLDILQRLTDRVDMVLRGVAEQTELFGLVAEAKECITANKPSTDTFRVGDHVEMTMLPDGTHCSIFGNIVRVKEGGRYDVQDPVDDSEFEVNEYQCELIPNP